MRNWKQLWTPKTLVVVHLNFLQASVEITATSCRIKSSNFKGQVFVSMDAVIEKFGTQIPYYIHVTGAGVLTRLVEFLPGYKEQLIVHGDKEDFYFTSYNDGHQVATSFFRKNLIEDVVGKIRKANITLLQISCGLVPVLLVLEDDATISFDYFIQKEGARIVKCVRNENPSERCLIQGIYRDKFETIVVSICTAIRSNNVCFETGLSSKEVAVLTENYRQFRQFRFFGVAIVSILFIAVTLNYFYINYLNTEIANLEVDLTLTNDAVSLLDKLKQEKNRKELLVSNSGVQQKEFISFFLDKIGETVPKAISLQDLEVFPMLETLKEKRKVVLQQQIIEIDGTSPESETLDDWMERMNRFDWVKSVELISYLKSENSNASFKLLITLNL